MQHLLFHHRSHMGEQVAVHLTLDNKMSIAGLRDASAAEWIHVDHCSASRLLYKACLLAVFKAAA